MHTDSLPRYSGGGLGRGFARKAHLQHNPHPSPLPEYRGREKRRAAVFGSCAILFVVLLTGVRLPAQTRKDPGAARSKETILAEISANALPAIDVPAMADAAYAKQITARRDAARQKRAALSLELYKVAPRAPELPAL